MRTILNNLTKKFNFFFKGHKRSLKVKKNIGLLFFVKGYAIIINFALIPLTLEILDEYKYGVWITIFNVLTWIELFDVGIGNGLRNKFTESIANNNIKKAREYVSTAYFIMLTISLGLIILFYLPWSFIDWAFVFNVEPEFNIEIKKLIWILFTITSVQFSLKLINTILLADHRPAYAAFVISISNTIIFFILLVFKNDFHKNLIGVGAIYTLVPLIIFVFFSLWMFNNKYKNIKPSIKFFKKEKVKDLFSLGSRFFVIQIAGIVIFQTDALIISHVLSPKEVTPYNITFRYFGIITMLTNLILTPLWSAYSEAYASNDILWIRQVVKKQLKGVLYVIPILLLMVFFGKNIIFLWVKNLLSIPYPLLVCFAFYTLFSIITGVLSMVLGGISKIRMVMYMTIFTMLINIPLSLFLISFVNNKSYGVILATTICLVVTAIGNSIQVKYFIFSVKRTQFLDKMLK